MDILDIVIWMAAIIFCLFAFGFIFAGTVIFRIYYSIKSNMQINNEKDKYRNSWR